jgi:uncharacterized protein YjlB
MYPLIGKIGYHSSTSGTVTLAAGEKMVGLWCVASAGGAYLTIDGGDHIVLPVGVPFAMGLESATAEWVGVAIVFSGTASYFVKTLTHF